MDDNFHPARIRSLGAALLDVIVALALLTTLAIAVLTLIDNGARDQLARGYARRFQLTAEESCPSALGKAFWFACASEVRLLKPPMGPPIAGALAEPTAKPAAVAR